jgi:hypothetical protein
MMTSEVGTMQLIDTGTAVGFYQPDRAKTDPAGEKWDAWFRHQWASSTSSAALGVGTSLSEAVVTLLQAAMSLRSAYDLLEPFYVEPRPHSSRSVQVQVEYIGRGRPRLFIDGAVDE